MARLERNFEVRIDRATRYGQVINCSEVLGCSCRTFREKREANQEKSAHLCRGSACESPEAAAINARPHTGVDHITLLDLGIAKEIPSPVHARLGMGRVCLLEGAPHCL